MRVFGVGAPRTGTRSLATVLGAAHEPEPRTLIRCLGSSVAPPLRDLVKHGLRLVSPLAGAFIEDLVECYPDALYLLTVREPRDWVNAYCRHQQLTSANALNVWTPMRDHYFGRRNSHPIEERELALRSLHTLDGYLRFWKHRLVSVRDAVPQDQLLTIWTHDMGNAETVDEITAFAGVPAHVPVHLHRSATTERVLDLLDSDYVEGRIQSVTAETRSRLAAYAT